MDIRLAQPYEKEQALAIEREVWQPFNWEAQQRPSGVGYHPDLHLVAEQDGLLIATIDACESDWDGDPTTLPQGGWSAITERARQGFLDQPAYACALGASVKPDYRSGGLAGDLLVALKEQALNCGYQGLLAPVLPSARWQMPRLSIEQYTQTRLADGRHFDPWVRVHERVGGQIIGCTEQSAVFISPRQDWERWVKQRLPDDGQVVLQWAGELQLQQGQGTLVQNSIWVLHQ